MGGGGGGCLFEAGRLLTFSAFRMGAYLRWALIRGWAFIRINTVTSPPPPRGRNMCQRSSCRLITKKNWEPFRGTFLELRMHWPREKLLECRLWQTANVRFKLIQNRKRAAKNSSKKLASVKLLTLG